MSSGFKMQQGGAVQWNCKAINLVSHIISPYSSSVAFNRDQFKIYWQ